MGIRRGFRQISALNTAMSLDGAVMEVEIAGASYKTAFGSAISILSVTEERPRTPSPYDDEFDGPAIASGWTQVTGTGADYTIDFSRLLALATVEFKQTIAMASPLRLQFGLTGWTTIANASAWIDLQGATKGFRGQLYSGSGGSTRELWASRLSSTGVFEVQLAANTSPPAANQAINNAVLTLLIDSTNMEFYVGEIGSPRFFYSQPKSNLGTLQSLSLHLTAGWTARFFRMDRATSAYAFPLAWAG